MEKKMVFVTGGNGFIGSRVVRHLLQCGYAVRCLLRSSSNTSRIDGLLVERHIGDIRDLEIIKEGVKGCSGIIHLACISNWADIQSGQIEDVVLKGTQNVLNAAMSEGNIRTVYVSSLTAVNGTSQPTVLNEESPFTLPKSKEYIYARMKKEAEQICFQKANEGQHISIVNPGEVYGPEDDTMVTSGNLIDFAKSNPVLVCYGGTGVVHVEDVAAGIVAAMERGNVGERYILSGDNLTFKQLAELTLQLLGQNKKVITLPNGLISFIAKWGARLRMPLPFEPAVIPYAVKYWFADNSKAKQHLGIQFRSAHNTLEPTLKWLKQHNYI